MFRSARLKLTFIYTLATAVVMAAFSIALYLALSVAISSNIETTESSNPRVEKAIQDAQLARARLALLGVNVAGWLVAATASYVVAGRTLAPIEAALARQYRFTAHASHELRTPLTVMKGEIDVTRARERTPAEYHETLDRIDEEIIHLDSLVGDLLALARMETGQATVERERGNLAEAIADVAAPLRAPLQQRGIDLQLAVPDVVAVLDWSRIRHLFANLLDNAARHASRGGRITITAHQNGRQLDVSVFNSGSPIDADDMQHLFVPFYRGKGSNPETGTGLGLALCDWIARSHGGSIAARNMNGGVSFDVHLPVDEASLTRS